MQKVMSKVFGCLAVMALGLSIYCLVDAKKSTAKYAFVNTQKLMTGFTPANAVLKDLEEDDARFKTHLKAMDDSLKSFMDSMTTAYDKSTPEKKKQWQDKLSYRNQEINNISRSHIKKMDEDRVRKMQGVYDKINVYISEFGKKQGYSIIFGTVQGGNILFGDGGSSDITQPVLDGLNERYK